MSSRQEEGRTRKICFCFCLWWEGKKKKRRVEGKREGEAQRLMLIRPALPLKAW
jgi:hypothetical protein